MNADGHHTQVHILAPDWQPRCRPALKLHCTKLRHTAGPGGKALAGQAAISDQRGLASLADQNTFSSVIDASFVGWCPASKVMFARVISS